MFLRILTAHANSHATLCIECTLSDKINIDRADGHCYSFARLKRSWTFRDHYFLMDHFLYRFSTFSEKMKTIYRLQVWFYCKMHQRIPFFLALRLSLRWFQIPLEGLSFVKTLAAFKTVYATEPFIQNMTEIVCFHWLTFDIFNYNPLYSMRNHVRHFFNIVVVFPRAETKSVTSIFLGISGT